MSTYEIDQFVAQIVPEGTVGQVAYRAVLAEAITKWEARDKTAERQQTFLPTSDDQLTRIHTSAALEAFRVDYGLRPDWHEPDESGITAYVIGSHLDNASGATVEHNYGELNVVLAREAEGMDTSFERSTFLPVAVVNLATLLSWATDGARQA